MANTTLNDRALIRLSGDDVRGFLQGLVTNDVSGNLPVWAALLTAQGKALFDFLIWADEADVLKLGQRWLAPADEDGAAGVEAPWRAHRLALGVTEGRAELGDGTTLWLECNAAELNGVSFSKGCYVGQENTARMNWRQKVNRRLVVVPIAEADAKRQVIAYPELGWSVEHRRVEGIDPAKAPAWMHSALLSPGS